MKEDYVRYKKDDYEQLIEVLFAFYSEKNYYNLLNIVLTKMMDITNADAGTLYVIEDDKLHFRIIKNYSLNIFQGADDKSDLPPIVLDERNITNISAYSAIKNEIVCIDDVYESKDFNFKGTKKYDEMTGYRTSSMLVFPLTTTINNTADVIGVIQLLNARDENGGIKTFRDVYDPPVLIALSNISANALANLRYAKEIDELFNSFVSVMTAAIDERSPYNSNHTKNVAHYCAAFVDYINGIYPEGHSLHFDENRREQLVMAAYLHDIGKIITPISVMDKPDRLADQLEILKLKFEIKKEQIKNKRLCNEMTKSEYDESIAELNDALELIISSNTAGFLPDDKIERLHTLGRIQYIDSDGNEVPILTPANLESLSIQKGTFTKGERMIMEEHVALTDRLLKNMKFNKHYRNVTDTAAAHHELLDGKGYPKGLAGDDISPDVRILTLMDIFEALTASDRPYRRAMPIEKALEIIKSMVSEGKLCPVMAGHLIDSKIWVNEGSWID